MQRTSSSNHLPLRRTNSQPPVSRTGNSSSDVDLSPYDFGPLVDVEDVSSRAQKDSEKDKKSDAHSSIGTADLVKTKSLGNAIKAIADETLSVEKPMKSQEETQPAPKKEKLSYWKKMSILVLTFAIALAKLLEPIIRSQFTPTVKQ